MNTQQNPAHKAGAFAEVDYNDTSNLASDTALIGILRYCLDRHTPTAEVCNLLGELEEKDCYSKHLWPIIETMREHAGYLTARRETLEALDPTVLDTKLRNRADCSDLVHKAWVNITTGDAPTPGNIPDLVNIVKELRARRATKTYATGLVEAATTGNREALRRAYARLEYLERLYIRAGIVSKGGVSCVR